MVTRNQSVGTFILLVLLQVIGFCHGINLGYMTLLNYHPSKADMYDSGFICYVPPIDYSGDTLRYGRSYAIDNTDNVVDVTFSDLAIGKVYYITPEDIVDDFGVYYCILHEDDTNTIVYTTKINSNAVIRPSNHKSSLTTNVGDTVSIRFDVLGNVIRPFVWRKDSIEITNSVDNSMIFDAVTIEDAGMYEMHGTSQRSDRQHSFINLIVRGCPRHKWGPPECLFDCEFCYNGGVCDDKTGQCICAPGFTGTSCQTECGGNRFGWDCTLRCTQKIEDTVFACRNYQFCLQDPYGCSCVTGYKGADCLTGCPPGTFGAGCTEFCHCHNSSDICNIYTGKCSGPCQSGWKGSNCQECEDNYFGENCDIKCPKSCHNCTRITGVCITYNDRWLELDNEPECEDNYFGENCDIKCPKSCHNCTRITGVCITYNDRWLELDNETDLINIDNEQMPGFSSAGVIGVAVGGVMCVFIILGLIYILIRKIQTSRDVTRKGTPANMEMVNSDSKSKGYYIHDRISDEDATYNNIGPKESRIPGDDVNYEIIGSKVNFSRRVNVLEFVKYVAKSKKTHQLHQEFELLQKIQVYPSWDFASQECNVAMNRSKNSIPYDKHRVVLDSYDGSDYYNASYIDGYIEKKHYIASQGPNKASLKDFWRMIWQKEINVIVMLTNFTEGENENCKTYWPENIGTYNDITVLLQREEINDDYCIRTFAIWLKSNDVSRRIVKQYHYMSWSDSGIPKPTSNFLRFMAEVRSVSSASGSGIPLLVHCSTGGGRTGTYIVIDAMLDMMKVEQSVDVLGYVKNVEEHRISMVQTVEQYIFIHDALVEFYLNGAVQISIPNFQNKLQYLKRLNPVSTKAFIEEEFDLLNSISQTSNSKFKKVDKAQVRLMSGKNYENASFLDGYKIHCRFIATGAPLVDTIDEFWQLVYEWEASAIVMLNHLDNSAMPSAIYWPETVDGVINSGRLSIQLKSQENREYVVIRNFSIKFGPKAGQKESTLKQYQVLNWPSEQDIPDRLETLLDVYEMVESDSVAKNPIIVHCMNGIGRTGVYCTVTEVLDRMRQDEIIDIFQTIKKFRANSSEVIENLGQYILCYDVVNAYLSRFATYSN